MRSVVWGACALAAVVGTFAARSGTPASPAPVRAAEPQAAQAAATPPIQESEEAERGAGAPASDEPGGVQGTPPIQEIEVPPPPFSDGIFPCTACHNKDMPVNRTRRELTDMHTDIVLEHDAEHRWCLDCHDPDDRDVLHLASGERVPFDESYRLCGQCHGEKYRDWRAGVHGRRSGSWNGHKTYLLCAHCHNPHQPRFKPIEPKPAPIPPARTVPR